MRLCVGHNKIYPKHKGWGDISVLLSSILFITIQNTMQTKITHLFMLKNICVYIIANRCVFPNMIITIYICDVWTLYDYWLISAYVYISFQLSKALRLKPHKKACLTISVLFATNWIKGVYIFPTSNSNIRKVP